MNGLGNPATLGAPPELPCVCTASVPCMHPLLAPSFAERHARTPLATETPEVALMDGYGVGDGWMRGGLLRYLPQSVGGHLEVYIYVRGSVSHRHRVHRGPFRFRRECVTDITG